MTRRHCTRQCRVRPSRTTRAARHAPASARSAGDHAARPAATCSIVSIVCAARKRVLAGREHRRAQRLLRLRRSARATRGNARLPEPAAAERSSSPCASGPSRCTRPPAARAREPARAPRPRPRAPTRRTSRRAPAPATTFIGPPAATQRHGMPEPAPRLDRRADDRGARPSAWAIHAASVPVRAGQRRRAAGLADRSRSCAAARTSPSRFPKRARSEIAAAPAPPRCRARPRDSRPYGDERRDEVRGARARARSRGAPGSRTASRVPRRRITRAGLRPAPAPGGTRPAVRRDHDVRVVDEQRRRRDALRRRPRRRREPATLAARQTSEQRAARSSAAMAPMKHRAPAVRCGGPA